MTKHRSVARGQFGSESRLSRAGAALAHALVAGTQRRCRTAGGHDRGDNLLVTCWLVPSRTRARNLALGNESLAILQVWPRESTG